MSCHCLIHVFMEILLHLIFISYYRRRIAWTNSMNLLLLREVCAENPFLSNSWANIVKNVNQAFSVHDIDISLNHRQCSEHIDVLVKNFKRKNSISKGKWVLFLFVLLLLTHLFLNCHHKPWWALLDLFYNTLDLFPTWYRL